MANIDNSFEAQSDPLPDLEDSFIEYIDRRQLRFESVREQALTSPYWGKISKSLIDIEGFDRRFKPLTGAIKVTESELKDSDLSFFMKSSNFHFRSKSNIELRGASYYFARNSNLTVMQKLDLAKASIEELFLCIDNIKASDIAEDSNYFISAALIDNLKNISLTLYNVLTFTERFGDKLDDSDVYLEFKQTIKDDSCLLTSAFYKYILGHFDLGLFQKEIKGMKLRMDSLIEYLSQKEIRDESFKLQEVDHPLVIAANAHANCLKHGNLDIVIGMPFGGLQPAIVNRMMQGIIFDQNSLPKLILVPLSTHSGQESNSLRINDEEISKILKNAKVENKTILVVDDNSNSGNTLNIIGSALERLSPKSIFFSIVELDPKRISHKQSSHPDMLKTCANLSFPDFDTAVRPVPIRIIDIPFKGKKDWQLTKSYAEFVISRAK